MKTIYRDGDVINTVERHYHFERLSVAIGVIGIAGFLVGLYETSRRAPPTGCLDSIREHTFGSARLECDADQTLTDIGYGRVMCRCKTPEKSADGSLSPGLPPPSYDSFYIPTPGQILLTPGTAGQITWADAGASWRAVP